MLLPFCSGKKNGKSINAPDTVLVYRGRTEFDVPSRWYATSSPGQNRQSGLCVAFNELVQRENMVDMEQGCRPERPARLPAVPALEERQEKSAAR